MTPEQARAAAEEILSKFGKVHDHWAEVCAAIILKHAGSALASPVPLSDSQREAEVWGERAYCVCPAPKQPTQPYSAVCKICKKEILGTGEVPRPQLTEAEVPPTPELLEALERAVKRGCACLSSNEDDWHADACPIPKMTAAIRKARGEAK